MPEVEFPNPEELHERREGHFSRRVALGYRGQKLRLEVDLLERGESAKPEVRDKLEALMKRFAEEEKRYSDEKKDIEKRPRSSSTSATSGRPRIRTSSSPRPCYKSPS